MSEPRKKRTRRARTTRHGVRVVDGLARWCITVGGIGTIVAVSTLCVFLVSVVVPLFVSPRLVPGPRGAAPPEAARGAAFPLGVNEYGTMGWSSSETGEFRCFRLSDGSELARVSAFDPAPAVLRVAGGEGHFLAGFADGTLRAGTLTFPTRFMDEEGASPELRALAPGASTRFGSGIVERTPADQLRYQELALLAGEPIESGSARAPRLLDAVELGSGLAIASLGDDDVLRVEVATRTTNLLTGAEKFDVERGELALELDPGRGAPRWLALSGLGDNLFLVWEDGALWRCEARSLAALRVVEKTDLLPENGERVTALSFLIGRTSLAVGDSRGRVRIWFRTRPEDAGTPDGVELARAHELAGADSPVSCLASSARSRVLAAGYADGSLRLYHVTGQRLLLEARMGDAREPVLGLALAPKDDGILAASAGATAYWHLDMPHPEAGLATLFAPVWYEGYPAPEHAWQSTGGSDDFEPKYGLWPLVFGTIKATFYSLLFGVPIALLAAVYTSEFLHPRWRARVKPTIEMMASLPSVVLGFIAALVIAPAIEDVIPEVLLAIFLLPFAVALGGYLWRVLPASRGARGDRYRLACTALCLAGGLLAARGLGPWVEQLFFASDFRQWLGGSVGRGSGGWMLLLLPLAAGAVGWLVASRVNPWLVQRCRASTPARFALLDLLKFLLATGATLGLVALAALLLERAGLDPRGGLLDTYVQRNALVVGFAMGFAIIPIVFTLSEDALSSVPDHLRAASLAAGATPWQTAMRVVVPTAMSGIFSAVMIGFGRAVGETMIVLMAAGGTPILDWNVFNGFRTLSANIATELPEAVQGGTHYRTLFLAALVLFAMTFALNTLAELVRLRYRRRSVQL